MARKFFDDSKRFFDGLKIGTKKGKEEPFLIDLDLFCYFYEGRKIAELVWIPTEVHPDDVVRSVSPSSQNVICHIMEHSQIKVRENYSDEQTITKNIQSSEE